VRSHLGSSSHGPPKDKRYARRPVSGACLCAPERHGIRATRLTCHRRRKAGGVAGEGQGRSAEHRHAIAVRIGAGISLDRTAGARLRRVGMDGTAMPPGLHPSAPGTRTAPRERRPLTNVVGRGLPVDTYVARLGRANGAERKSYRCLGISPTLREPDQTSMRFSPS
jgi:hypothetical protein